MKKMNLLGSLLFASMLLPLNGVSKSVAAESNDLAYYPEDYAHSVARFQAQAARLVAANPGSDSGSRPIPSAVDTDLEVDYLNLPARSPASADLLVLSSGVHGAEAYAGSAIQQMFFQEILPGINPEKMGVLVIHSLNPYGFKHFRRVTEKNIDLNRNFPVDDSLYQVKESSYDPLSNLLEPKEKVTRPLTERLAKSYDVLKGLVFKKYTVKELGDAIGQGQHRYPNGLEYGGNEPEPQVQIFKELVQKYSKGYKRVIYLDLHTGLGSANQLHMMTADGVSYSNTPILQQLLKKDQDGKMYDIASGGDPGFYPTPGDIILYFQKVVVPNQENVGLTMEFGTIGTGALNELKELNRLILENQGHHYGYFDKGVQKSVEEDFHELFCPKSPKWRALVIDKARYVLGKVIERLGDNK